MSRRISEEQLRDSRFRKTEIAILTVFSATKDIPTPEKLAKQAGVSKATLYRHHKTVYDIVPDYKNYILAQYHNMMRIQRNKKNIKIENLYRKVLFFICRNKRLFLCLFFKSDFVVVEEMINYLKPKISELCALPKNSEKIFVVYKKEIAGLIEAWAKTNFEEARIDEVLADVVFLTKTMRKRLQPFLSR